MRGSLSFSFLLCKFLLLFYLLLTLFVSFLSLCIHGQRVVQVKHEDRFIFYFFKYIVELTAKYLYLSVK